MEIIGLLKVKFDTQVVSDRFKKREFVLTTEPSGNYPQHVSFQLTQDKCTVLDGYHEGDEIKVHFNLRGREWNGPQGIKYFNTLEAWRIEKINSAGPSSAASSNTGSSQSAPVSGTPEDADDFPF
ncbi:MAG: hypothetical protein RIR05_136 [Bacteroidota bacterium]|jgi:hypothetical protein|nr:DUF3127 domain-containing protein [Bacteroidia bacterium]